MHCGGCPRVPGAEFVQLIYPHGGTFKGTGLPFAYGGEPVSEKGPWVLFLSPLKARPMRLAARRHNGVTRSSCIGDASATSLRPRRADTTSLATATADSAVHAVTTSQKRCRRKPDDQPRRGLPEGRPENVPYPVRAGAHCLSFRLSSIILRSAPSSASSSRSPSIRCSNRRSGSPRNTPSTNFHRALALACSRDRVAEYT